MTNVVIYQKDVESLGIKNVGFSLSGHAGDQIKQVKKYKNQGNIVCASVSILSQTCLNMIVSELNIDCDYKIDKDIPLISLKIKDNLNADMFNKVDLVITQMLVGFLLIEQEYPKEVCVRMEEI